MQTQVGKKTRMTIIDCGYAQAASLLAVAISFIDSAGASKVPWRTGPTGPSWAGSRIQQFKMVARATLISSGARFAPMQPRFPPPKGKYSWGA